MQKSHLRSRVGCRNPTLNRGSQVGTNFHPRWERWDPTIPTLDPGRDCQDPAYIPPDILPGYPLLQKLSLDSWIDPSHFIKVLPILSLLFKLKQTASIFATLTGYGALKVAIRTPLLKE